MEEHTCIAKEQHYKDDGELGYDLGVYPEDTTVYKHENYNWCISVGEYTVPIIHRPFCGVQLNYDV